MKKLKPELITIEDAVAKMVNMDFIGSFDLLEIIEYFLEEAEVFYENARIDQLPERELIPHRIHMEACRARYDLTKVLLESLQFEVDNPEGSMIVLAEDTSGQIRLTLESVSNWASDRYGIGIPSYTDKYLNRVRWEDITIIIKPDNMLEWYSKGNEPKSVHFKDIGLMGKKSNKPNKEGFMLMWLHARSRRMKKYAEISERKSMFILRRALSKVTGLQEDPFRQYNKEDGWEPRFDIIYEEFDSDETYTHPSKHESHDENKHTGNKEDDFNFEDEYDEVMASQRSYDSHPPNIDYKLLMASSLERIRRP